MKRGTQVERERRQIMTEHYKQLQSMVPGLSSKTTRAATVDETITYIHHLEEVIKGLEAKTKNKPSSSSSNPHDIVVTYFDRIVFVGIHGATRPDLACRIFQVFDKHMVDVLTAGISSSGNRETMFTITARVNDMRDDAQETVINKLKSDLAICLS